MNTADPTSLIHIVLKAAQMPGTASVPTEHAMPGFNWRLTDRDVANVFFVRRSGGNQAAALSGPDVAKVRNKVRKDVGAEKAPQR